MEQSTTPGVAGRTGNQARATRAIRTPPRPRPGALVPGVFRELRVPAPRAVRHNLTGQARGLTRRLGSAGVSVAAVTPVPLRQFIGTVAHSVDQLPRVSEQLDVLMAEVHAQRLGLQALEVQLEALDQQLGVLERSLAPIAAWSHQPARLRASLSEALNGPPDDALTRDD